MSDASNDQGLLSFVVPVVSFISCEENDSRSALEEDGAVPVDFEFAYELFTADGVDITSAVQEFEAELLGGVADELGLLSCISDSRRAKKSMRGMMGESEVLGVSSEPVDEVSDAECTTRMLDSSKLTPAPCTSVNGFMTAWFPASNDRRHLSESDVDAVIENFISNSYASKSILGVSYIPLATSEEVTNEIVVSESKTSDSRVSIVPNGDLSTTWKFAPGIILLASIVSLVALVGLIHVIRKHKSDESVVLSSVDTIEPQTSEELGPEPPQPIRKNEFRRTISDTDDCSCSVATEENTQGDFINRMPACGWERGFIEIGEEMEI